MDEFFKYVKSLPEALDEKEQEFLFYEYAKTKDPKIREKLITHNLRLCASYAINYCKRYNIPQCVDEVNSECIIALVKGVEKFDISKGSTFKSFLLSFFNFVSLNYYKDIRLDSLYNYQGFDIVDCDDKNKTKDLLNFIEDPIESNFVDEIISNEIYEDILRYINSWKNERDIIIFKHFYGIDGFSKLSQNELADYFNVSPSAISHTCRKLKSLLSNYIREGYGEDYSHLLEKLSESEKPLLEKNFDTINARNDYIINSIYGLNCEQKTKSRIAKELDISESSINKVIGSYKKSLPTEQKAGLHILREKKIDSELLEDIFNAFYGLNGYSPMSAREIMVKFDLGSNLRNFYYLFKCIKNLMIESGKYSKEQLQRMNKDKEVQAKDMSILNYEYEYNSYYGLNGFEKKSQLQLSKELKVDRSTIKRHIELYEEYIGKVENFDQSLD